MAPVGPTTSERSAFGPLLRNWRHQRRFSQLALAMESDVSQRHISFLESGRAQPSRDMVLRLATVLAIPLRERNLMLVAAGFAPVYKERDLADPEMEQVRKALDYMLRQHEPYPALVVDRVWNILIGNDASTRLLTWLVDPQGMENCLDPDGRVNLLRLMFHPGGLRPFIRNWHDVAGHLIERVHREVVTGSQSDPTMALLNELLSYPDVPRTWRTPNWEVWQAPILTVEFVKDDLELHFFSTITTLGTAHDITLQDLRIECLFAADKATEHVITHGINWAQSTSGQSDSKVKPLDSV